MHADDVLSIPERVLQRRLGDEMVLLNLEDEQYYNLTGVSARLYQLLAEPRTFGDVVEQLLAEYDVDRATLEADLQSVIAEMRDNTLVVVQPA